MALNLQSDLPAKTRRYPRLDLETEIKASMLAFGSPGAARGRCVNINEGGMAGVFATSWSVGTHVKLQFSVPNSSEPLSVRGVVRNRASYCYGFEFIDLTYEQRSVITRTCKTLALMQ